MTAIEKAASAFIALFLKEVGYHEKASNAQLESPTANSGSNNWNKFAAHIDSLRAKGLNLYNGAKNGYAWCDITFDDTMIRFVQSLGLEELEAAKLAMQMLYQPANSCGAGCEYSADYYRAAGAWIERGGTPKIGDQIFYGSRGSETHTGGVYDVNGTFVHTVEGNYGDQVTTRKLYRTDSSISGYGRPKFSLVAKYFEEPEKPKEETMSSDEVKKLIDAAMDSIKKTIKQLDESVDTRIANAMDKELGPMIKNYDEIPWDGVRDEVREMVEMKVIDGGTDETVNPNDVNMRLQLLRVLVVGKRFSVKAIAKSIADKFKSVFQK